MIWRKLVPTLRRGSGRLTAADGPLLADLCLSLHRLAQCERLIEKSGILIATPGTDDRPPVLRRNPAILAAGPYRDQVNRLAAKFGMSPADRARLTVPEPEVEEKSVADLLFEGALAGREYEG